MDFNISYINKIIYINCAGKPLPLISKVLIIFISLEKKKQKFLRIYNEYMEEDIGDIIIKKNKSKISLKFLEMDNLLLDRKVITSN